MMGIVSLFADITYEGARSATGQFLRTLGASGAVVGVVAGLAECVGYTLRIFTGMLSDKTGKPWVFTLCGYAMNLIAVPLLAVCTSWEAAAMLIVLERLGKAIRTPSRDAMLSYASEQVGRGWGFGLHEALDRLGALIGPLLIAGMLVFQEGYRPAFVVLAIPAALALIALGAARFLFPTPVDFETKPSLVLDDNFPKKYWIAVLALSLVAAGTVDFPLIGYHLSRSGEAVAATAIPLLYAFAMATDGITSLIFGRLYDRRGVQMLMVAILLSSMSTPLLFLGGPLFLVPGAILWGIGMGTLSSLARALIASIVPVNRRAVAYGIFNLAFGIFWFLGSSFMGLLYESSITYLVILSLAFQLAAIPLLATMRRLRS